VKVCLLVLVLVLVLMLSAGVLVVSAALVFTPVSESVCCRRQQSTQLMQTMMPSKRARLAYPVSLVFT
jgi:hypothetical protein